ncbi:hypothetical protein WJX74_000390 [Apatococcus lobatus]|uniref:Uncharacterized protein n=1 Tax=Apatococcus lobatus TaxID=904363 RepID=A0AAW1QUH0_9CHLO
MEVWGRNPATLPMSVSGLSTGLAPVDSDSLRSAIRNVTADADQITALVQEYFEDVKRSDPARELDFREFLDRKAQRSHPTLEIWLDWILFLYKMALPFLLFFTVIKLTGGRQHQEQAMEQFEELGDKVTPMEFDERTPQHAHQPRPQRKKSGSSSSRKGSGSRPLPALLEPGEQ